MFKRKIYSQLLDWKKTSKGKTALLIEGPRRVGKSTIVEEFAKNEYESYILIDFYKKRLSEKYRLFLSDRGEQTLIDDIPTLSSFTTIDQL